jgi:predicted nuclease with TOPRIM domain
MTTQIEISWIWYLIALLTVISGIVIFCVIIKGIINALCDMADQESGELQGMTEDEFGAGSTLGSDVDKLLEIQALRRKLDKIRDERDIANSKEFTNLHKNTSDLDETDLNFMSHINVNQ